MAPLRAQGQVLKDHEIFLPYHGKGLGVLTLS